MIIISEVAINTTLPKSNIIIPVFEISNITQIYKKIRTAMILAAVIKYLVLVNPNLLGIVGTPAIL